MNVYQKLNQARKIFHEKKLRKSGHNKFAGYDYFELGDFIIPALDVFNEIGLMGMVSFGKETATLTIVNCDQPEQTILITSPMSNAALKGCHEVQNLGAVQTYLRRYLWVAALEIVEHDALDSSQPLREKGDIRGTAPKIPATSGVVLEPHRQAVMDDVVQAMLEKYERNDIHGCYEEYIGVTDSEEKFALWDLLKPYSKMRKAIKDHGQSIKE